MAASSLSRVDPARPPPSPSSQHASHDFSSSLDHLVSEPHHKVLVALDASGRERVELEWVPSGTEPDDVSAPTCWLLIRTIPITTNLSEALALVLRAEQEALSVLPLEDHCCPSEAPHPKSPCNLKSRGIQAVRVCYVVGEIHCYALLVQCCCCSMRKTLREDTAVFATPTPTSEFVVENIAPYGVKEHHGPPAELHHPSTFPPLPRSKATVRYPLERLTLQSILQTPHSSHPMTATPSPPLTTSPSLSGEPPGLDEATHYCPICQVEPLAGHAVVTTLCQHVFHLQCYAQLIECSTTGCPICRLCLYDVLSDSGQCDVCGTSFDLWSCLVCGHVYCGSQSGSYNHQKMHFCETGHTCAVQCFSHRIWNHLTNTFIHQEVATLLSSRDWNRRQKGGTQPVSKDESMAAPQASASSTPHLTLESNASRGLSANENLQPEAEDPHGSLCSGAGATLSSMRDDEDDYREDLDILLSMDWSETDAQRENRLASESNQRRLAKEQLVFQHYTHLIEALKEAQKEWYASGKAEKRLREQTVERMPLCLSNHTALLASSNATWNAEGKGARGPPRPTAAASEIGGSSTLHSDSLQYVVQTIFNSFVRLLHQEAVVRHTLWMEESEERNQLLHEGIRSVQSIKRHLVKGDPLPDKHSKKDVQKHRDAASDAVVTFRSRKEKEDSLELLQHQKKILCHQIESVKALMVKGEEASPLMEKKAKLKQLQETINGYLEGGAS